MGVFISKPCKNMKYGTFSFIVIFLIFEQSYSFNFNRKSAVPFLKQEIEPLDLVPKPSSRFSNFKLNNVRNRSYRQMSITNNMAILKEKLINALILQREKASDVML